MAYAYTPGAEQDYGVYSDLCKSLRGFRPRCWDWFSTLSAAQREVALQDLQDEITDDIRREVEGRKAFAEKLQGLGLDPARFASLYDEED